MTLLNKYAVYHHLAKTALPPSARKGASAKQIAADLNENKRDDMTWKDHLVMLLHIGAEIEHSLMVQYLYAAYSLGNEDVPEDQHEKVRHWQENILAVAKEEMGHFLTVQNILTLLGAPTNLGRLNLPWDIPFYPFPFQLEPLTLESVACYVYAEMPSDEQFAEALKTMPPGKLRNRYRRFKERDRAKIVKFARKRAHKQGAHRVGGLYAEIAELLTKSKYIADDVFQEKTYPFQASSDDWGRGYQPRPKMLSAEGSFVDDPAAERAPRQAHVIIDRAANRTQAVEAIKALSHQGEAPLLAAKKMDEYSHFDRFLEIYQELDDIKGAWKPARPVPKNPTTMIYPGSSKHGFISAHRSQRWASLFNLRYRLLLRYLAHSFRLARSGPADSPNLRAMVMHRVFGEMYNLKTIAGILVRLPQREGQPASEACAAPPFEMPYTLDLSGGEYERWVMNRDLLHSAQWICKKLQASAKDSELDYLNSLVALDQQTDGWMTDILAGLAVAQKVTS